MNIPMNKEQYAEFWNKESNNFESSEIYIRLADLLPEGRVLEIGCGNGKGTHHLSQNHKVLSLDNNPFLINIAKEYLDSQKDKYQIHKCDLFKITEKDKKVIQDFKPEIIVAWFIGSAGEDVNRHIINELDITKKGKLYREKLEDVIVSKDILVDSVKTINFALRGAVLSNASREFIYSENKKDYDTWVFNKIGFEVTDVETFSWNTNKCSIPYAQAPNPNLLLGNLTPSITSIIAKRNKL
jgi:SAM-dependent methyltransferase